MKTKIVSIVIPCFNEDETVNEFYRRVNAMSLSENVPKFEFIFVNDGSQDGTAPILNKLAKDDDRVKVLHLAHNRGHQIAISAGIDYATGEVIVTIDADLQDPPELIPEMLNLINQGNDIVHAQRKNRKGETWFKLTSAQLFYTFFKFISNTEIIDNCGDFRAFTKAVQYVITSFRTPYKFYRATFVQLGFRQTIIQYDRDVRYAGKTKYPFFKMLKI